jgi:hypothetical protein
MKEMLTYSQLENGGGRNTGTVATQCPFSVRVDSVMTGAWAFHNASYAMTNLGNRDGWKSSSRSLPCSSASSPESLVNDFPNASTRSTPESMSEVFRKASGETLQIDR